jgi:hypothetical protein
VCVAQLVELLVVVQVVAGSSPVDNPKPTANGGGAVGWQGLLLGWEDVSYASEPE